LRDASFPASTYATAGFVKGVRFRDHRVAGDILELARALSRRGRRRARSSYDITAARNGAPWIGVVRRVARLLDIPFCVAGGIRSVGRIAEEVLNAGAEKVSVNFAGAREPRAHRGPE